METSEFDDIYSDDEEPLPLSLPNTERPPSPTIHHDIVLDVHPQFIATGGSPRAQDDDGDATHDCCDECQDCCAMEEKREENASQQQRSCCSTDQLASSSSSSSEALQKGLHRESSGDCCSLKNSASAGSECVKGCCASLAKDPAFDCDDTKDSCCSASTADLLVIQGKCVDQSCKDRCGTLRAQTGCASQETKLADKVCQDRCASKTTCEDRCASKNGTTSCQASDRCTPDDGALRKDGWQPVKKSCADMVCRERCAPKSGCGDDALTSPGESKCRDNACKDKCANGAAGNGGRPFVLSQAQIQALGQFVSCCDACMSGGICCGLDCCAVVCCLVRAWQARSEVEMAPLQHLSGKSHNVVVLKVGISNMTCSDCAELADKKVRSVHGVVNVRISLVTHSAEIHVDPAAAGVESRVLEMLSSLGFPASIQSRAEPTDPNLKEVRVSVLSLSIAKSITDVESTQLQQWLTDQVGAASCTFRLEAGHTSISIEYNPDRVGARALLSAVTDRLPDTAVTLAADHAEPPNPMLRSYRQRLIVCIILAVPVLWFSFISPFIGGSVDSPFAFELMPGFPVRTLISWVLSTPIQFGAAWPLYVSGYRALRFGGTANIDVLVMLSSTVAFVYSVASSLAALASNPFTNESFFDTSAIMLTLIILGRYLETMAKEKTVDVLHKLAGLQPASAILLPRGTESPQEEIEIDVRLLHHGDILKLTPGSQVPTDGIVVWGETTVDESLVTGESAPVRKLSPPVGGGLVKGEQRQGENQGESLDAAASVLLGGTINQSGVVYMRVTHTVSENTLSNIAHMVKQAQLTKPPVQRLADRVSAIMVPAIVTLSFAVFFFWFALAQSGVVDTSSSVTFALQFALATLVVSCPCAVGLAVPTAIMVGTGVAAKLGVLFADGAVIEQTHRITSVVFDKTGTLTQGKPSVKSFRLLTGAVSAGILSESEFWTLIGCAELNSEHALGRSLLSFARSFPNTNIQAPSVFEAVPGKGVSCRIDDRHVLVGTWEFLTERHAQTSVPNDSELLDDGVFSQENAANTVIFVSVDDRLVGLVALDDSLKPEARVVVNALTSSGIDVWILSGDNQLVTSRVASELGIDGSHVMGRVLPADKAARVKALQKQGQVVCMVGDGINDSAALAQADVGMAVGAGSDIALAAADIVLVKNDLRDVLQAINISRVTCQRIRMNFFWAFLYNFIAIPLAIGVFYPAGGVYIPPVLAGLSELLSSVPVILFSLLLKRYQPISFIVQGPKTST